MAAAERSSIWKSRNFSSAIRRTQKKSTSDFVSFCFTLADAGQAKATSKSNPQMCKTKKIAILFMDFYISLRTRIFLLMFICRIDAGCLCIAVQRIVTQHKRNYDYWKNWAFSEAKPSINRITQSFDNEPLALVLNHSVLMEDLTVLVLTSSVHLTIHKIAGLDRKRLGIERWISHSHRVVIWSRASKSHLPPMHALPSLSTSHVSVANYGILKYLSRFSVIICKMTSPTWNLSCSLLLFFSFILSPQEYHV